MHIDFPLILVSTTLLTGLISLLDIIFLAPGRKRNNQEMPTMIDYARSFFPVLLIVLIIRSFIVQPFRVPTGSLEPTILPNDFVAVNQFAYGLRLPVLNKKIVNIGKPKKGDIVVFRYPVNPKLDYVKRVIGIPGDHITYKNKILTINGQEIKQQFLKTGIDFEPPGIYIPVDVKEEILNGIKYKILINKENNIAPDFETTVPEGQYFVMGDNRDNSIDSRYWGFVPEENLIGKAFLIWFSWDSTHYRIRWSRIGTKL